MINIGLLVKAIVAISVAVGIIIYIGKTSKSSAADITQIQNMPIDKKDSFEDYVDYEDIEQQREHFRIMAEQRRKAIFTSNHVLYAQFAIVPQISCPTVVRPGGPSGKGKWLCNPWRASENCVVYSIGVPNDTSFETDIYRLTKQKCRIFSFENSEQPKSLFDTFKGTFNKYKISNVTISSNNEFTVEKVADILNHSKIDLMKIDLRENEYQPILALLKSDSLKTGKLAICQIVIDLRYPEWFKDAYLQVLTEMEKNRFYMFYKHTNNVNNCNRCDQFSFIHHSCLSEYAIHSEPFNFNFS